MEGTHAPLRDSYDEVLYPGHPFPQTHPDRLATLATLFGMHPAPVERCRVLELGCGDGANLIPMAFSLAGSEFVGIDAATRPIGQAQRTSGALGLKNVSFRRLDLSGVSSAFGEFDYIIAYGVYSWVPEPVRDRLLAIVRARLAPEGVALVSYDARPGGALRMALREMMLFHVRGTQDPARRIADARALLRVLAEGQTDLKPEAERLLERVDEVLYHDELAETYAPVYFREFVEHAGGHGLQYLAEAEFPDMHARARGPAASEVLDRLPEDVIVKEQYLDFLKCRKFRQTLLCRREVRLDRTAMPEKVGCFSVSSAARPLSENPDLRAGVAEEFRVPQGASMSTAHPAVKAAMVHLARAAPRATGFAELLEEVRCRTAGEGNPCDARALGEILLRVYAAGLVQLHVCPPRFALEPGEHPVSSPLARLQVREGRATVTTLRHTRLRVEGALERQLLLLLDGTRDRSTLQRELAAFLRADPSAGAGRSTPEISPAELDEVLTAIARLGLLTESL